VDQFSEQKVDQFYLALKCILYQSETMQEGNYNASLGCEEFRLRAKEKYSH
jgi:hypothetical protein